jgi:hypothetical protein
MTGYLGCNSAGVLPSPSPVTPSPSPSHGEGNWVVGCNSTLAPPHNPVTLIRRRQRRVYRQWGTGASGNQRLAQGIGCTSGLTQKYPKVKAVAAVAERALPARHHPNSLRSDSVWRWSHRRHPFPGATPAKANGRGVRGLQQRPVLRHA